MRLFDEKFRENKFQYVLQSVMGGLAVAAALLMFDVVNHPVIIAAFGASGFIAFTMPHKSIASPRHFIGGYIIGIAVGGLLHYLTLLPVDDFHEQLLIHILAGGLAVGAAMFLMAITNTEHAPAASIAVGLVINDWDMYTVMLLMVGVLVIVAIKRVLREWLIDLF